MIFGQQRKNSSLALETYKRQFNLVPQVCKIGFLPGNTAQINAVHPRLNFVFVLRGNGHYAVAGKSLKLTAPCVLVHIPGICIESGPTTRWDEVFFSYSVKAVSHFERNGLLDSGTPVWPIGDLAAVENTIMKLREHLYRASELGVPDMIDWLCAGLILNTRVTVPAAATLSPPEIVVQNIRAYLEKNYREDIRLEVLIRENGLSESHFRRLWNRWFTCSPAHYIAALRVGEACRLLADPSLRIGEIAEKVGYKDVFHFSRRFHQITGQTASEFRQGADILNSDS